MDARKWLKSTFAKREKCEWNLPLIKMVEDETVSVSTVLTVMVTSVLMLASIYSEKKEAVILQDMA